MDRSPRPLVPILLVCALVAALASAATAAAETRVGEATQPANGKIPAEADIVGASATYDSTTGTVTMTATTLAAPQKESGGEPSEYGVIGELATLSAPCTVASVEGEVSGVPAIAIFSGFAEEGAEFETLEHEGEEPSTFEPATKSVAGVTTTLTAMSGRTVNKPYNCAVVGLFGEEESGFLVFPIAVRPVPPAPAAITAPAPTTAPTVAPQPAPAALLIARVKPLKLTVGRSRTVRIKVTDTGATATGPGSLLVKAPKGVIVKPETQKVPALLPGGSWTLSVSVQLTTEAKKKSTISLTGTAPGLGARSSFVIKLTDRYVDLVLLRRPGRVEDASDGGISVGSHLASRAFDSVRVQASGPLAGTREPSCPPPRTRQTIGGAVGRRRGCRRWSTRG